MVACTRSVAPSAVTWTDSMTARSSLLRSATVVVGAAHRAGMSLARARIAPSPAGGRPPRALLPVPLVVFAEARLLGQRVLPLAFELAHHEAVFGLGQLVLAPGPAA